MFYNKVACALLLTHTVNAANILAVFLFPSVSHFLVASPFLESLARRGHNVTVLGPKPRAVALANYHDVTFLDVLPVKLSAVTVEQMRHVPLWKAIYSRSWVGGVNECEAVLSHPKFQDLLWNQGNSFDLLITEVFGSFCYLGLAHHFQMPVVFLNSRTPFPWLSDAVGDPDHAAYVPNGYVRLTSRMSLLERVANSVFWLGTRLGFRTFSLWPSQQLADKYFRAGLPPLENIATNASLLLLNTVPSFNRPRPHLPNVVEVGGIHITPSKDKLPEDVAQFLDESEPHGVIFFSLGSMIRAALLPDKQRLALLEAFSRLPQRVLWKWEEESIPGQPANVMVRKWLPQQQVLRHPSVRLFFTHGGQLSMIEAIKFGIPVVGMPLYADQISNIKMAQEDGIGVYLDYDSLSYDSVFKALQTVLSNSSFKATAERAASFLNDEMESPLDRAVYWTDYVLRHNGAPHMSNTSKNHTFISNFLLDLGLFTVVISLAALYLIVKVVIGLKSSVKIKHH